MNRQRILLIFVLLIHFSTSHSQEFSRSELSTTINTPWEIQYGQDDFLWITESGGKLSRIDPSTGAKTVVYTASDYFPGSPSENSQYCTNVIGSGTLGMAMHPDFSNSDSSYVFFMYSYNSGTVPSPATKFKIKRLKWDSSSSNFVEDLDIISGISNGFDHWGGRLMTIRQNGKTYLFVTVGDHGISEDNNSACYQPQSTNPNNFTQDPTTDNGKVHRFNIDGSAPLENPIPGNSFYTRGHRNPQGLMHNTITGDIYAVEHGDRTDDEVNILIPGMNYGWKYVRGFHNDNNYPGEDSFISNYVPNPQIPNDSLVQPLYTFCSTAQPTNTQYMEWCTVAPSDGVYYGSTGIPEWTNSLLITTLKNGTVTDMSVIHIALDANGDVIPGTMQDPNPTVHFVADQALNGRLRDICVSPDGKTIYLINNGGSDRDKITVYTYDSLATLSELNDQLIELFPNPGDAAITIRTAVSIKHQPVLLNSNGTLVNISLQKMDEFTYTATIENLSSGFYFIQVETELGLHYRRFIKK